MDDRITWTYQVEGGDLTHAGEASSAVKQSLLLTGLVNPQVVRTAEMMDMKCIVFVRGKQPDGGILALAEDRQLVVMTTKERMYNACGLLYINGLRD